MTEKRQFYSVSELREAVGNSICFSDVCKFLNVTVCSFNYKRIRKLCAENAISTDHFDVQAAVKRGKFEWSRDTVLCENSEAPRSQLRAILKKFGLLSDTCSCCGISSWMGAPITIELDHVNGINNDNRLTNLRWLCPNCHSQTDTFRNSMNRKHHAVTE